LSSVDERRTDINAREYILGWLDKDLKERADPVAKVPTPASWTDLLKAIDAGAADAPRGKRSPGGRLGS
jgi:hypothetical protein